MCLFCFRLSTGHDHGQDVCGYAERILPPTSRVFSAFFGQSDMAGRVCRPGPARPFSQKPEPNFLGSGTRKSEFSQKPDPGFTRPCLLCYITYSLPDPTDPFFGVPDPNHV